ncbi:Auxin-responsive protein IAA29 [Forsythia ovata]|uniref:Auxin-responsive protein n=1 Tax=Forsythia ovata TaxID=205694 RepID=A0ABD1SJ05_9LAMI
MELQLRLALSSNSDEGFDLNNRNQEQQVEDCRLMKKKRCFDETFGEIENVQVPQTLPLLDHIDLCVPGYGRNECDEEDGVVGWPPINSWRKRVCHQAHHDNRRGCITTNYVTVKNGGGGGGSGGGRSKSMHIKVKMEGVGIARKVDLSRHHSYQTLTDTLSAMFGDEKVQAYKLTYQDKEGDWLLAGDMPWGTFINSVQRLKLLRNGY